MTHMITCHQCQAQVADESIFGPLADGWRFDHTPEDGPVYCCADCTPVDPTADPFINDTGGRLGPRLA